MYSKPPAPQVGFVFGTRGGLMPTHFGMKICKKGKKLTLFFGPSMRVK
jgi:hypothetical protein